MHRRLTFHQLIYHLDLDCGECTLREFMKHYSYRRCSQPKAYNLRGDSSSTRALRPRTLTMDGRGLESCALDRRISLVVNISVYMLLGRRAKSLNLTRLSTRFNGRQVGYFRGHFLVTRKDLCLFRRRNSVRLLQSAIVSILGYYLSVSATNTLR